MQPSSSACIYEMAIMLLITRLGQATHIAWSSAALTNIFSTAACVKKTVTPPTDKTVAVLALVS